MRRPPPTTTPFPYTTLFRSELEDAARIDGANAWQIFTRVVLPLSQPVLAALAIFTFRSAWNDFLWPLIAVNRPEMFPLPVALDRKSTRLNSSHLGISYAVFC